MKELIQFCLIDHITVLALVAMIVCGGLKLWILYHCPSHPLYRGERRPQEGQ